MATGSPLDRSHGDLQAKEEDVVMQDAQSKEETATTNNELQPRDQATDSNLPQPSNAATTTNTIDMAKKVKLTAAEKAEAKAAKEAEAQRKAEEKARKEELKRQKDEEKRLKDEEKRIKQEETKREKEEKQKVRDAAKAEKDAAKAEKDAEKKAKEDAQAKKDKAQMRLGAFFRKPAAGEADVSGPSSRRSSIASIDASIVQDTTTDTATAKISEYDKTFQPFFVHAHTELAPAVRYPIDEGRVQWATTQIEKSIFDATDSANTVLGKRKRSSYQRHPPVKRLMLDMQGSTVGNAIDLDSTKPDEASRILRTIPVKVLKFKEDVRPPWIGTYSRAPEGQKYIALCRNPFRRELPHVNYDYDSEAEWEEPEEGEDLNSEGEEEEEDEDEDMDEFLNDEDAEALPKRKQLIGGDLEPVCTTLHFETTSTQPSIVKFGATTIDLEQYRIGVLLDNPVTFPINPFSTSYWTTNTTPKKGGQTKLATIDGIMQPPIRQPLNTIQGPNQTISLLKSDSITKAPKSISGAKPLPPELLDDFKKAVSGSNLSKIGLVEVLKKDFPQITKKTVEQTLLQVAKRVGKKEAEKTWQLVDDVPVLA